MQKTSRAINRVYNPDAACIKALRTGLLANKPVFGKELHQLGLDKDFQLAVSGADHILTESTLVLDGQLVALPIKPQTALRRFTCQLAGQLIAAAEIEGLSSVHE